ncbi:MAG: ribonuclease J [Chloroflexi bacterium]|nr:ribonuclease J [Chloroflexota bacterium]MBU1748430.1 ribonuclease J [Chloroflexota bacterium]MBU1878272.1 ribonuclease J [Chloroflexota bacterium]
MTEPVLRLIPLGGLGEIGRNMMVLEYGNDMIVIDCGLMFPENEMLGIDIVIPNMEYVLERQNKLRGVVITHGHEDHIGGLPYLLDQISAPVYATALTRGLIEVKLQEYHPHSKANLHTIEAGDSLRLGCFGLEFFHVCHSIPDGVGIAVDTPVGLVVHSGDFKFDHTPVDGRITDFAKLAELGQRGVHLLLSDSTNAESPGYTPSEMMVGRMFDRVFAEAPGRVLVATFASNISRIQQVIDTALSYDRKVGVVGRSMVNNVRMALELGYLDAPDDVLLPIERLRQLPEDQVAIVTTGSQGEPMSALTRMAAGEFRQLQIVPGDTVVISATPIPGNEESINNNINNLFRLGANVIYDQLMDVHVSGHGAQEEEKLMLNLVQPRHFVPIHGEYRHLALHAKLAEEVGVDLDNIFLMMSGDVLELTPEGGRVAGQVSAGYVFVDGLSVGNVGHVVLRDRKTLARDGFLIAVVGVDSQTGRVVSGPDIVSRGFVYMAESEDLIEEAKGAVVRALEETMGHRAEWSLLNAKVKETLSELLYNRTKRRPMILPVVMEV